MKNAVDFVNDLFKGFTDPNRPPMKFDTNYQECSMCFNSGFVAVSRHDQLGRVYRGVTRCQSCDYWFNLSARLNGGDK